MRTAAHKSLLLFLCVCTFAHGSREISISKTRSNRLAFGFCSSHATATERISDIASWWDSKHDGLILVDDLPDELPALPKGLLLQATSAPWHFVSNAERCAWGQLADTQKTFPKADWYVLGDDDTLFVPEALQAVLSKYDASKPWYMGAQSESAKQNHDLGVWLLSTGAQLGDFAFGGGGLIISQGLMQIMIKPYEQCLHNHDGMIGGDQRIGACVKVLSPGTELTMLEGMHQIDTFHHDNDPLALLEAHPVQPLLSLHHMQDVPLPGLGNLLGLRRQIQRNPYGVLQQSVCQSVQHGTFSVAAGLSVRWWAPSIEVDMADLTDPEKRGRLPTVSQYFVYSEGLNTESQAKSKSLDSWYALYDSVNTETVSNRAIVTKVLVQEPSGPQRWQSAEWDRLQCSVVIANKADNSVHILLGAPQTAVS